MDDPLRPKIVPLAAETVLWFEFLLDPGLLTVHLNKLNPDPSPIDLISQFILMSPDNQIQVVPQVDLTAQEGEPNQPVPIMTDCLRLTRKQYALKILMMKVCTFLNWNLDMIEKGLPVQKQVFLLKDMCTLAFGKPVSIPFPTEFDFSNSNDDNSKAICFALVLYHRWVLRMQLLKENAMKASKPIMHVMGTPEPINIFPMEAPTQVSVDYLTKMCNSNEPFHVFSYDSFVPLYPNSDNFSQKFDNMVSVTHTELKAQLLFDLCGYYMFAKQYSLAKLSIMECMDSMKQVREDYNKRGLKKFLYCHIQEEHLHGYMLACGVCNETPSLMERFHASTLNQYKDIIDILRLDNKAREIPLINRRIIELDVEGAYSQGIVKSKGLDMQVAALNVIRAVFENGNIYANVGFFEKYKTPDAFIAIANGVVDVLPKCSASDRNKLKEFLVNCVLRSNESKSVLKAIESIELFSNLEIEDLKRQITEDTMIVPPLASQLDWKWSSKISRIEIGSLERQLINCTTATAVRKLLVKLAGTNPTKPLYTVNPGWQIPQAIKSYLMSMPRGFLQDFAYVLIGKAREMAAEKDFGGSVLMLSALKSETQRPDLANNQAGLKLAKLVTWEILLIQICQCLEDWTKKLDLGSRCKQCLAALQGGEQIMPRPEIIDYCSIMLLNLNDWNAIMFLDKRVTAVSELTIAFAATFIEMEKLKGSKKICRDAWDITLSIFCNSGSKRGMGQSREPQNLTTANLHMLLTNIRDPLVFSLAMSLLAKIYNILRDDPNFDLNAEYMNLWPSSISNPIAYNIHGVSEMLNWLLKRSLKYYPQNTSWLKLKGDLELALGNNEAAMRCYVNALVTGTDYCTVPLQRPIIDDYIIRKMIKCSSNLGCYMQAAVLCQFLDEIDYGLAFKNISEKSSNFSDAMDAYYNCIFDPTLLEFIVNLHTKRGEHSRKLEAIAVMSNLELNSNNNDEIKREAASIRKTRFIRALAKQYLLQ